MGESGRFVLTGAASMLIGAAMWCGLIALDRLPAVSSTLANWNLPSLFSTIFLGSPRLVSFLYALPFFFASLVIARCRWSHRPALASFFGNALFLAVYMNLPHSGRIELFVIAVPLIAGPLGAATGLLLRPTPRR